MPGDYDFPDVPLTRLLDDSAAAFPTKVALAFLGTTLTYRDLKDSVDSLATALAGLGVDKGDRVALVLPNCPQYVISFFAALRLGAIVVPTNPLYTPAELGQQLRDAGVKVVICLDKTYAGVAQARDSAGVQHVVVTSILDYLPRRAKLTLSLPLPSARAAKAEISAELPAGAPIARFLALLDKPGTPAKQVPVDARQDLAVLQYTGGVTGTSRGVMLTHHNLVANAYQNRLWLAASSAAQEVTLAVLPLFHAYGLTACMTTTLLLGGTLVLLPRFDVDTVFAAIDEWRPTVLPGLPPLYSALMESPRVGSHDVGSIRACLSGGMKLPRSTQERFETLTGGHLIESYGLTEASACTHANPISGRRKLGTVGLPLPGTEAKVVDGPDHSEVPVGRPGQLAVRGPQVFVGYWQRPSDARGSFTTDGYLLTGDVAMMDDEGYFSVLDRMQELISSGGVTVYPSEVENALRRLDGVADVCVVGLPDGDSEIVKAYVVRSPDADLNERDVQGHCRRSLAPYKVPRLVEFRESLPRSVVGKVLRRVLLDEIGERERERPRGREPKRPPAAPAEAKAPARAEAPAGAAAPAAPRTPTPPRTPPARAAPPARHKAPPPPAAPPASPVKEKPPAPPPAISAEPVAQPTPPPSPAKPRQRTAPATKAAAAKGPSKITRRRPVRRAARADDAGPETPRAPTERTSDPEPPPAVPG